MGISRVTPLGCLVALCACAWALGCGAPEPTGGRALDDAGQEDTGGDGADASADTGVGADADVDQGPSCGDGACGVGEDASSCAVDCARCGDEVCSEGEDIGSCEQDCWAPEDDLVLAFTLDADRVTHEVILFADRCDIAEELQRAHAHVARLRGLLSEAGGGDPHGKKIDFYLQELIRETNTMASKSNLSELTEIVVSMKSTIEQMREQAANIE